VLVGVFIQGLPSSEIAGSEGRTFVKHVLGSIPITFPSKKIIHFYQEITHNQAIFQHRRVAAGWKLSIFANIYSVCRKQLRFRERAAF
jgi:hypothetical protein